jgi:drug/metabolite transporter (DMT)-like permease
MENTWVLWALLSALMGATSDALTKKALLTHNEYLIAWLRLACALPFLLLLLAFVPIPPVDGWFFAAALMALPVEVVALILYTKALKVSPLSLTVPFLSLTPVFLIVVPYLILGERVSATGGIGVVLIAAGGYVLNIGEAKQGFLGPIRAIGKEKGSFLMIIVALLYSVTSTLGKMAIEHSSPVFFGIVYFTALTVVLSPIALSMNRGGLGKIPYGSALRASSLPGLCYSVLVIAHVVALNLTKVAYMISVKRLGLLMGVVYGYILFRESHMKERFAGALLMVVGAVLIVLFR